MLPKRRQRCKNKSRLTTSVRVRSFVLEQHQYRFDDKSSNHPSLKIGFDKRSLLATLSRTLPGRATKLVTVNVHLILPYDISS